MYDNVNNSLISYSDPYVTFFKVLTSHDGHLLKAVCRFIQDYSITQPINFPKRIELQTTYIQLLIEFCA